MDLIDIKKDNRVEMTGGRTGTVVQVFPTRGNKPKRKPRILVQLDNKPTMHIKVAESSVVGLA